MDQGPVDISDAIATLNFLFLETVTLECHDTADADDNGEIELTDAVRILNHLFLSGDPPTIPYPVIPNPAIPYRMAGTDPTGDSLGVRER